MKKLIMILLAAAAFSCGDANRSSERNDGTYDEGREVAEPADSTTVESDTTNTGTIQGQDDGDTGGAGTESQRDSL